MARHRLTRILIYILITAFLSIQSAAAHIHLAENHNHDGSLHQHQSEAHAHQSIDNHATNEHDDAIDSSHQTDHANIVELDHEFSTVKNSASKNTCMAMSPLALRQPPAFQSFNIKPPAIVNTKLGHLYRSTINLRAPPELS